MVRRILPALIPASLYLLVLVIWIAETAVPVLDEWMYIEAARGLAKTGSLQLSPLSIPVALFDSIYGAGMVLLAGDSFSTFTMASGLLGAAGSIALYDLLSRHGCSPLKSSLGVAAYLFGPLFFALNSSFMTDGHALNLAVISAAMLSRGVDDDTMRASWLIGGSVVASLAYLSRPAAVAVVAGAAVVLAARKEWQKLYLVLVIPAAVVATHIAWQFSTGVPAARAALLASVSAPSASSLRHASQLAMFHGGLWLVPLLPMVVATVIRDWTRVRWRRPLVLAILPLVPLAFGVPTLGDWLTPSGLLPLEVATFGNRPAIAPHPSFSMTVLVAVVVLAVGVGMVAGRAGRTGMRRLSAGEFGLWCGGVAPILLSLITLSATSGVLPDRYLVVLLPAVIFTVLTRTEGALPHWSLASSLLTLAVLATFSVLATADGYRTQSAVFRLATETEALGTPPNQIDGGAAWTGLLLGHEVTVHEVQLPHGRTWWRDTFAVDLDPKVVVMLAWESQRCAIAESTVPRHFGPDVEVSLLPVDGSCGNPTG